MSCRRPAPDLPPPLVQRRVGTVPSHVGNHPPEWNGAYVCRVSFRSKHQHDLSLQREKLSSCCSPHGLGTRNPPSAPMWHRPGQGGGEGAIPRGLPLQSSTPMPALMLETLPIMIPAVAKKAFHFIRQGHWPPRWDAHVERWWLLRSRNKLQVVLLLALLMSAMAWQHQ